MSKHLHKVCWSQSFLHTGMSISGVATGEWVGPNPPLLFRPLLGLAQIRWKVFLHIGGIPCMYIVNFTTHQQRNMVRTPHFLGAGDATDVNRYPDLVQDPLFHRQPMQISKYRCHVLTFADINNKSGSYIEYIFGLERLTPRPPSRPSVAPLVTCSLRLGTWLKTCSQGLGSEVWVASRL